MKNLNKELTLFLEEKFPDVYAAFLTGSAVDEYFNDESDYDIYVITNTRDYVFNESFVSLGFKIQLIHLPLNRIDEILWYDWFSRMGIHLTAFKKANILVDDNGYLPQLIEHCKAVFDQGPPSCTYNELKSHKVVVSNFVSDLKGNNYEAEKVIICHDLYKAFIKFYLDYYGYWNSRHKHLARQMNLSNPTLSGELLEAVRQFHVTLDPTDILDLVNNEMAMIGDVENGYSMYSGLISVKANYMILRYDFKNDPYQEGKMLLKEAIHLFPRSTATFVFRSRPLGDDDQTHECLYLIIAANTSDELNTYYIPKVDDLALSKDTCLGNTHYPVNFDIDLFLGGKNMLNSMLSMLKSISLRYTPLLEGVNDSISLSLQFFMMFRKAFFCADGDEWTEFLLFVQNSWIVRAYDNKNIHNIRQLLKAKNMVFDVFAKQFAYQRNDLLSVLNLKESSKEDGRLLEELTNLCKLIKSLAVVKSYQQHPINTTEYSLKPEWVIYRNMLDYILGMFMYKESQKPYIIYLLIEIQK